MANKTEAIDYNKFIGDPDEIEYVGMIDEIEVLSKPETPVRNEYQHIQLRIVDGSLYANDSDDNIFHHLGRIKGEPGIDGQDGRDGKDGERGLQGLGGIPGEKGLSGVSIVGARGYQGLSGRDGKKGEDGRDGKVGVQGLAGKDGSRGIQGLIGIDGSIPDHEIDVPGSRFRFKEPSGKWGEWIRIPRGSGGGGEDWTRSKKNFKTSGYVELGPGKPGTIGSFRLVILGGKLEIQKCTALNWGSYSYHGRFG